MQISKLIVGTFWLSLSPNSNQIVSFSCPLGAGFVYNSSIPLDYYLDGGSCGGTGITANLQKIYTPNVLTYMHTLNPRLRFLPPVPVAGVLPAFLANTPIAVDRIPGIAIYGSANPALPVGSWNILSNPLVLTNGFLRLDGINLNSAPQQFFRAGEMP